ncbi:hypothetical protein [Rhizobium grahamii]|uniref:hypothetical protein n=1 Tax=Rhizobium grahamii TaxID=1120045 RepID=UPI003CC816E7
MRDGSNYIADTEGVLFPDVDAAITAGLYCGQGLLLKKLLNIRPKPGQRLEITCEAGKVVALLPIL